MKIEDVGQALHSALAKNPEEWPVGAPSFSDHPEMWMNQGTNSIGLFQENDMVKVVVWVGSDMRSLHVDAPEKLPHLLEWIGPQLEAQTKTDARLADEERKRAAIEPPPLEKVLAALRNGTRLQLGAGRWYETYFWKDGMLKREIFDEGYVDEEEATEKDLQDSLAHNADQAQRQL